MKHIEQIIKNFCDSSTEPKLAILDDGTSAIVKLKNGLQGNLVLFNEFVCYKLGILLDIPMPPSGVCLMDDKTLIEDYDIASESNYGCAFYSTLLTKATTLKSSVINFIENLDDFNRVLLFDHVIFNPDRNLGNLLVLFSSETTEKFEAIDHTHAFINGPIWDSYCLRRAMEEDDLQSVRVLEENAAIYNMFFRHISIDAETLYKISAEFKKRINRDVIISIIEECPREWRPGKQNEDSLVDYLMYRINNLDVIISTVINYLKK